MIEKGKEPISLEGVPIGVVPIEEPDDTQAVSRNRGLARAKPGGKIIVTIILDRPAYERNTIVDIAYSREDVFKDPPEKRLRFKIDEQCRTYHLTIVDIIVGPEKEVVVYASRKNKKAEGKFKVVP